MMKYQFIFSGIFLLMSYNLLAQQIKFLGVVQDTTGKPLSSASLVAAELKTKAFQGYAITDEKGQFVINFKPQTAYTVKISYMGYQSIIDTIYAKQADIIKKYSLKTDPQQLDGVEIKYEMPVTVKGDTIVYNADSFTNGHEKKLGDVLKKMPGIEVDKDGTVKVEGNKVKKVMVEGKNFFEGDSKLASKNIPANAVKKVEVLRNFNENTQMKKFDDNEESFALNIRLKKGKKNFWFGEITAGGGTDGYYLVHPKLFYYSPKKTLNIILDANNTGEVPLTFMDFFSMTGGFSKMMRRGNSNFNNDNELLGFSLSPNGQARSVKTKFGAFNYNYKLSRVLNWEGFVLGNYNKTEMLTQSETFYTANGLLENSSNKNLQENFSAVFKTALKYEPSQNLSIKYNLLGKVIHQNQRDRFVSNFRAENQTKHQEKSLNLQQSLDLYNTFKNEDLMSLTLQHKIQKNLPLLEIISPQALFATSSLINLVPQNTYELLQNKQFSQQDFSMLADYYWILNDVSHLDFALGNKYVAQSLNSDMAQILDNGQLQGLNDNRLKNDAGYYYTDLFIGLYYKLLWGRATLRPGLSAHYFHLTDSQDGQKQISEKVLLLPEFKIKYVLNRGKRIYFTYKMTNTYPDINKYIQGYLLNSFNSLQKGNRYLTNTLKNTFSLKLSMYSMLNFSHFYAGITYSQMMNALRMRTRVLQTDMISEPVNLAHENNILNLYLSYGKRYVYWKYSLRANVSANDYYSIINAQEVLSHSLSQNYTLMVNSNLSGFINFDVSYNFNLNNFKNQFRNSLYLTDKPSIGIELNMFKNTTQLNIKYDYYNYRNEARTVKNTYAFLSTELFYQKEGSAWMFSLKGNNLLGTKSIDKENLTDLYIATSKYYVMPHYWLLGLTYKL